MPAPNGWLPHKPAELRELEARLGIRLMTRVTRVIRSLVPTMAGERLLQTITPRLPEIEQEIGRLTSVRDRSAGSIRLTLSDHALDSVVWPKLKPVFAAYPDINVELILDRTFRAIVEERFDAGVRLGRALRRT